MDADTLRLIREEKLPMSQLTVESSTKWTKMCTNTTLKDVVSDAAKRPRTQTQHFCQFLYTDPDNILEYVHVDNFV